MADLHFRANSQRALMKLLTDAGIDPLDHNVAFDVMAPGDYVIVPGQATLVLNEKGEEVIEVLVPMEVDAVHWYGNLRLLGDKEALAEVVIKLSFATTGQKTTKQALYDGGPSRETFTKDFGEGDAVELIDPPPQFPRRMYLAGPDTKPQANASRTR